MCGITGVLSFLETSKFLDSLTEMNTAIAHRGLDDEGYTYFSENDFIATTGKNTATSNFNISSYYHPKPTSKPVNNAFLGLGHHRLSILDLTPQGHQPMCDESANFWITFNGEIYNYLDLKQQLVNKGYVFRTNTDTEVLLKSYIEWGENCVQKFNGMWAFTIYNRQQKTLFCSRDRFGVKPFYYVNNPQYFAFASEQKAILKINNFQKKINPKAAFDYLALGKIEIEKEGFFANILELPPAHNITIHIPSKQIIVSNYYELKYNSSFPKVNYSETKKYTKKIRELLTEAVRLRLQSDVPIGTCLSGGIDSSVISCLINNIINQIPLAQIGKLQKVFTASFPNQKINESIWAKKIVNQTKSDWKQVYPNRESLLKDIQKLVYHQDIPFFGTSTFSQYKVLELVGNSGVKVTLDGQGADELFTGYQPHYSAFMNNAFTQGKWGMFTHNLPEKENGFAQQKMLTVFPAKVILAKIFKNYFKKQGYRKSQAELGYINFDLWMANQNRIELVTHTTDVNLNRFLHSEFTGNTFKNLMRTGDRNSMTFSVEARMPFADDINLIEYLFEIPGSYKVQKSTSKYLLRQAMQGIIPDSVQSRKDKIGFATPESQWILESKNELLDFIPTQKDEFVDWVEIRKNWKQLTTPLSNNQGNPRLWRLLNFAIWRGVFKL